MAIYNRILALVDLSEVSLEVARRAFEIQQASGAVLELLHVVEYVPVEPLSDSLLPAVQIESELIERAKTRMAELAAQLGVTPPPWRIETGNVKGEILRIARESHPDLIVIGARERHGLSILVNLTEDTVLHAAPCDVLAVRITAAKQG
ncbi:MAG: hypothetical protein RLZZ200_1793 [Pseudomonadota bacterium]|jgi:universal stress protein A